jgi:23S rRNA pseudouridine2605 synthase
MPPRFAYWTIILEGKPTAFRAQHREDLLPTLKQLQTRHPDVVMKWYARGKLWESPEDADAVRRGGDRERRPPGWRPGGEHRDPRARFDIPRDEKRRRFAAKLRRDARDRPAGEPPHDGGPERDRRPPERPFRPVQGRTDRPRQGGRSLERPAERPGERGGSGRPPRQDGRRGDNDRRGPENRKAGNRPDTGDRRSAGNRKFGGRPGGFRSESRGPARGRKPWGGGPGRGGRGGRGGSGSGGGGS